MKTQFIALGIMAASMGFAADNGQMKSPPPPQNGNNCCKKCSCSPCCCNSPTPDCKVNCTCFVPQWYNMSCDCGFFISADFLYWYSKETNIAYAAKAETVPLGTSSSGAVTDYLFTPESLLCFGNRWKPGVRVGLGWNTDCDGWDLSFYWTWYRGSKSSSKSVDNPEFFVPANGGEAFISQWTNYAASTATVFDSASGSWTFRMNNFDLELGKRYWLSKCFTMRPFAGIRGVWTKTKFKSSVSRGDHVFETGSTVVTNYSETDKFNNRTWGVGLLAGFEPSFYFTPCFSIYAGSDAALVWGKHRVKKTETYAGSTTSQSEISTTVDGTSKASYGCNYMTPILDLELGFRWENYYCDNQYHFEIDLGWEHHVMFHLNDRYQTFTRQQSAANAVTLVDDEARAFYVDKFTETHHDVSFGGLVLRLRFDF